jgi:ATP-dependent RNA helicase MSS116
MSGPPPKRKWPRGRGGGGRGGGDRATGANTTTGPASPRPAMGQQPKRPRVENAAPKPEGTVDVRQMYSTAAGDAAPKPFSELKGKLNQGLLDGLDKMGFE